MRTKVIQDADLIEMTRKQIDSISAIAEKLKEGIPAIDSYSNSVRLIEWGNRLEAYLIGLRKTIDLLETRIARAR